MPDAVVIARLIDAIPIDRLKALMLELMTGKDAAPIEPASAAPVRTRTAARAVARPKRTWTAQQAAARKAKRHAARAEAAREAAPMARAEKKAAPAVAVKATASAAKAEPSAAAKVEPPKTAKPRQRRGTKYDRASKPAKPDNGGEAMTKTQLNAMLSEAAANTARL